MKKDPIWKSPRRMIASGIIWIVLFWLTVAAAPVLIEAIAANI